MPGFEHLRGLNGHDHPVCSICIANYNGSSMLNDCLASVFAQEGDISIEVIVHDDASTDDSLALLRGKFPQVTVLASTENVGFCVGNNRMVSHARGKFILLLNNDAALFPDALQTLLAAAEIEALSAIRTLPQYDWQTGDLIDRGCLLDPFYNPIPNLDPDRINVAMVIGACLFLPHSLWVELGGFPEWMESIGEDLFLCCHARLRGYGVTALPNSGYRHRRGATFSGARKDDHKLSTTFRRRRLSERNKTLVMVICTPTLLIWPLLALHLLALACEGIILTCSKRDWRIWRDIYVSATAGVWVLRRQMLASRQEMQRNRRSGASTYLRVFRPIGYKLLMFLRHGMPNVSR
jgi:GT2 family glycosyltransferase